jgi:hypothetical protein
MPVRATGPERALTWAGEPLTTVAIGPGEPRGKLDTSTVNGPEDELDWDATRWAHEKHVARLWQWFIKATRETSSSATPPGLA